VQREAAFNINLEGLLTKYLQNSVGTEFANTTAFLTVVAVDSVFVALQREYYMRCS
jgi:hypothetical protein